jgi:hypothetical protein
MSLENLNLDNLKQWSPTTSRPPLNVVTVRKSYITIPTTQEHIKADQQIDLMFDREQKVIAIKCDGSTRTVKKPSNQSERRVRIYSRSFVDDLNMKTGHYPYTFNADLNAIVFQYEENPPEEPEASD